MKKDHNILLREAENPNHIAEGQKKLFKYKEIVDSEPL